MSELTELLARVEAATGPDRAIDCSIAVALGGYYTKPHPGWPDDPNWTMYCRIDADGSHVEPGNAPDMLVHNYTASVDASLTLVERKLPEAYGSLQFGLYDGVVHILIDNWRSTPRGNVLGTTRNFNGQARTLPLAILAALLKALIVQEKQP